MFPKHLKLQNPKTEFILISKYAASADPLITLVILPTTHPVMQVRD